MAPLLLMAAHFFAAAQPTAEFRLPPVDWRQVGGTVFEANLAGLATGPVEDLWYSSGGARLTIRTASGRFLETADFETWNETAAPVRPDEEPVPGVVFTPEPGVTLKARGATVYALGRAVYRSDDGGLTWANLSEYRGRSIIGRGLTGMTISPLDADEIAVAGQFGVWRSTDGGLTWAGINDSLPNLPALELAGLPGDGRGARILADGIGILEWTPGERFAWRAVTAAELVREEEFRERLMEVLGEPLLTVTRAGDFIYAGSAQAARLWVSPDRGASWRPFEIGGGGPVSSIHAIPGNPRVALAALAADDGARILRTTNGGLFWDDLTNGLPAGKANAVAADPSTGAVYAATAAGVFFTVADLLGAAPPVSWIEVSGGLPNAPVLDLRLDAAGNQLYVVLDGAGVFAGLAPHRFFAPAVVNAADLRARPASPGVLLSVMGGNVVAAGAGPLDVPILAATARESQIQIPFEAAGTALSLALTTTGSGEGERRLTLGLPLRAAAPAIFEDRAGAPMVLDAGSGVMLDAMTPGRAGSRLQILATGLGKVDPNWPTGMPAPLEDPPRVVADVTVMLDRTPVEPIRATLAPGYIGFYIVEFVVPDIVNEGPNELYIEAAGQPSNRTRIYLEQ